MFPYYNQTAINEAYKNIKRQEEIDSLFGGLNLIENEKYDVRDQVPRWIHREYGTTGSNFINFFQSYFDWLYSSEDSGSGYNLGINGFLKYIDIDTIPDELIKTYSKTFLPSFPDNLIGTTDGFGVPLESLREYIKKIKTRVYHKKGRESTYQDLIKNLFGVLGGVDFEYPGRWLFKLNRGNSEDEERYSYPSHLNENPLTDSDWFQPFTYIVNAIIDPDDEIFDEIFPDELNGQPIYKDAVLSVLHPIGMKALFETSLEDWTGPTGPDTDDSTCEYPILGNYFPYTLDTSSTINSCTGCTLPYYNEATDSNPLNDFANPTHVFPNWSTSNEDVENFGHINIGDFYLLCSVGESPNIGITSCTELGC